MWDRATATTMMAIAREEQGVESYGKPASIKKSWASKGWATAAGIANSAGRRSGDTD